MVVKVSMLGDTLPSVVSPLETLTVTLADGAAPSRTVKVDDVLSASLTVLLLVGVLVLSDLVVGLSVKVASVYHWPAVIWPGPGAYAEPLI